MSDSKPYFHTFGRALLATTMMASLLMTFSRAQYPTISNDVAAESERRFRATRQHSDEAWRAAQPAIEAAAANGKPFIQDARRPDDLPQADIPAFPGAQGGGMYSFGGRGGKVYVVTSLEDNGPGTFREALEAGGPRIVVFNVAGIIRLDGPVVVRAPYLTIDGSSAPGDGVCIAGATVEIDTHDVVIRHLRFRRGETWVGDRNDALGGNPIGNIMIDHVSASWGLDENLSMYRHMYEPPGESTRVKLPTVNITIQNSIFSEGLNTYNHAFGSTLGGYNSTFHHNLWACNTGRNPSVGMVYDFTFINNVIYNWRHRTIDGGDHRSFYTIINNYFKPGPVTPNRPIAHRILKPEKRRSPYFNLDFGKAYVAGNFVEGNEEVTKDNWAGGVQLELEDMLPIRQQLTQKQASNYQAPASEDERREIAEPLREQALAEIRSARPYPHSYVDIQPAEEAYEYVLENVGATLPKRDAVDERIVKMVRTGTVTYDEGKGIITDIEQVGGYPEYKGEPYKDSDSDGMPDDWEQSHGLNPQDASDAAEDLNGDGYTNIEDFLNGLDPAAPKQQWPTPRTYEDLFWQSF
ncbi:pectate lyase family protein [Aeoliella sp.]|uniref:pectate lyase family protein n=1 Tax=Aeoliella sp. TaxID=2795800 RepID=UPI003CCB782A